LCIKLVSIKELYYNARPTKYQGVLACLYDVVRHNFVFSFWAHSQICEERLLGLSCPSVRPHGTTRLPPDGLSGHWIFDYFSKICGENASFIEM